MHEPYNIIARETDVDDGASDTAGKFWIPPTPQELVVALTKQLIGSSFKSSQGMASEDGVERGVGWTPPSLDSSWSMMDDSAVAIGQLPGLTRPACSTQHNVSRPLAHMIQIHYRAPDGAEKFSQCIRTTAQGSDRAQKFVVLVGDFYCTHTT